VNAADEIRRAMELGVDGIISDYPDRVRKAAAAMGRDLPDPLVDPLRKQSINEASGK